MSWEVDDSKYNVSDWKDSTFEVKVCDTSVFEVGCTIYLGYVEDADELKIIIQWPDGERELSGSVKYSDTGLLSYSGVTPFNGITATGEEFPAGTPIWLTASMVTMVETETDIRKRNLVGLTLINNPENAGVMGAEETGSGPDF